MIATMDALSAELARVQAARARELRCELDRALSARLTDADLTEALVTGLPLVQGIQPRILRNRGRGIILTAKLRYRDGVRIIDALRRGDEGHLSPEDAETLLLARTILAEILVPEMGQAEILRRISDCVAQHIRYVHVPPGHRESDDLVSGARALRRGRANCQGFADAMYLLCALAGLEVACLCGQGRRQLHLWNQVCVDGTWTEADVSKAARSPT